MSSQSDGKEKKSFTFSRATGEETENLFGISNATKSLIPKQKRISCPIDSSRNLGDYMHADFLEQSTIFLS